jgi:tetratricopeptide (TPR) repeat protein
LRAGKRYNGVVRVRFEILALALLAAVSVAQSSPDKDAPDKPASDQTTPDKTPGDKAPAQNAPDKTPDKTEGDKAAAAKAADHASPGDASSSRDTRIDLSPPRDDAKSHPSSQDAVQDLVPNSDTTGVQEFHPWNPLKASKDIQVGDFYFKRKNYKAALERYKEALYYKDNDAVASFRVAECQEKLGDKDEARTYFEQYLKILPEGPLAKEARASLEKLGPAQ